MKLSDDLSQLEVRTLADQNKKEPSAIVRLAELVRIEASAAPLRLTLHTTSTTMPLTLRAVDASQLAFWVVGLQDLGSVPPRERVSRGGVLWRVAKALYRGRS